MNSITAWVVMNNSNLYYGKGGFCEPDIMKATLFLPEEAAAMLRVFPESVAIRVEVEECEPELAVA